MTSLENNQAELISTMLDHIPISAAMINKKEIYLHVNQPFADFHHNSKEYFIGKTIRQVLPEASYDRIIFPLSRVLDGEVISYENSVETEDHRVETFMVNYQPIKYSNGQVEVFLATMVNITQQQKTEQELSESLLITEKLVDASPVGILFMKPDGEITYENPAMQRMMGVPKGMKSPVTGKKIQELPPIIESGSVNYIEEILQGKTMESREFTYTSLMGKTVKLEAFGASYRDRYQRLSGTILLVLDISARKKAESLLLESEDRYRKTFMTSPDAININRLEDGLYIDINEGFTNITGYTRADAIGKSSLELDIWADPKDRAKLIKSLKRKGKVVNMESKFRLKSGQIVHALMSAVITQLGGGSYIISITRPIEEIKKIQNELITAKDKAQESDRLKSAFLANMSHEIRTPLNSILGFTEILETENVEVNQQKEYLQIVHRSGEKLLHLINELIDLSKIEAGQLEVSKRATSVSKVFHELNQVYRLRCQQKNLVFKCPDKVRKELDIIHTDPDRLRQILTNLVENAIKYTELGEITVNCEKRKNQIQFSISDTGIGIEENHHTWVFEQFRQVNDLRTRTSEGAGLGLAICKSYVHLLGGTIWLRSIPGQGSTFYFTLPIGNPTTN